MNFWFVYIVECSDHSFYTGIAKNVEERIKKHNSGLGAKYTCGRRPVKLIFSERFDAHKDAIRKEIEIKRWPRAKKETLISGFRGGPSLHSGQV